MVLTRYCIAGFILTGHAAAAVSPGPELSRLQVDLDADGREELVILRASDRMTTGERVEIWRDESDKTPEFATAWREAAYGLLLRACGEVTIHRIGERAFIGHYWNRVGIGTGMEVYRQELALLGGVGEGFGEVFRCVLYDRVVEKQKWRGIARETTVISRTISRTVCVGDINGDGDDDIHCSKRDNLVESRDGHQEVTDEKRSYSLHLWSSTNGFVAEDDAPQAPADGVEVLVKPSISQVITDVAADAAQRFERWKQEDDTASTGARTPERRSSNADQ